MPDRPGELGPRRWWEAIRRTVREFRDDNLMDWGAALTFYGLLSLFPMLVVAASLIGLSGASGSRALANNVRRVAPPPVRGTLAGAVESLQVTRPTAGITAAAGLAVALWAASRYIAAFIRAANAVYETPERRPLWKLLWLRLGLTVLVAILLTASVLAVTFTGRLAHRLGDLLGLGSAAVTAWEVLKWPLLALIIVGVLAVLYHVGPSARQPGLRWVTPGGVLAVITWAVVTAGFTVYVSRFGSYNKIYGSLATIVIFMVWLWLSNLAILLGAEFDAELQRERFIEARRAGTGPASADDHGGAPGGPGGRSGC
jgi:membrane protein